jgi:hypothetical protein
MATIEATALEYWRNIKDIAEECKGQYPDSNGDEERYDHIHDSIDRSYWGIYHHANKIVLQASDNEPDGAEVRAISKADADWRNMRQVAAYLVMEADIYEALRELDH